MAALHLPLALPPNYIIQITTIPKTSDREATFQTGMRGAGPWVLTLPPAGHSKQQSSTYIQFERVFVHGKYVYSTLALGKERELVKEETALRKEKEAVCCYVHVHVHVCERMCEIESTCKSACM